MVKYATCDRCKKPAAYTCVVTDTGVLHTDCAAAEIAMLTRQRDALHAKLAEHTSKMLADAIVNNNSVGECAETKAPAPDPIDPAEPEQDY